MKLLKHLFYTTVVCYIGTSLTISFWILLTEFQDKVSESLQRGAPVFCPFFEVAFDPLFYTRFCDNQVFVTGEILLIFTIVFTLFIALAYRSKPNETRIAICSKMYEHLTSYRFRLALAGVTHLTLFLFLISSLSVCRHFGVQLAAFVADDAGFYELAETVYAVGRDDHNPCTIATLAMSNGHDADQHELRTERLNRLVSKLYGPKSIQMAHRYRTLAHHLSTNFWDDKSAIEYARKAERIYAVLDAPLERAWNLSFLAFDEATAGNYPAARRELNTSRELLESEELPNREKSGVLNELYCTAYRLGDERLKTELLARANEFEPSRNYSSLSYIDIALIQFFTELIFLVLFALLIKPVKNFLLHRLERRWISDLRTSKGWAQQFSALNKLIDLSLYKNNLEEADRFSKQLLTLAE